MFMANKVSLKKIMDMFRGGQLDSEAANTLLKPYSCYLDDKIILGEYYLYPIAKTISNVPSIPFNPYII